MHVLCLVSCVYNELNNNRVTYRTFAIRKASATQWERRFNDQSNIHARSSLAQDTTCKGFRRRREAKAQEDPDTGCNCPRGILHEPAGRGRTTSRRQSRYQSTTSKTKCTIPELGTAEKRNGPTIQKSIIGTACDFSWKLSTGFKCCIGSSQHVYSRGCS